MFYKIKTYKLNIQASNKQNRKHLKQKLYLYNNKLESKKILK